MKAYTLEFSFFSSLLWEDRIVKITALSHIQLIRGFILATKYIHSPYSSRNEKEIRKECWQDNFKYIREEDLIFPIIEGLDD